MLKLPRIDAENAQLRPATVLRKIDRQLFREIPVTLDDTHSVSSRFLSAGVSMNKRSSLKRTLSLSNILVMELSYAIYDVLAAFRSAVCTEFCFPSRHSLMLLNSRLQPVHRYPPEWLIAPNALRWMTWL